MFFSSSEFCGQRRSGGNRRGHVNEGKLTAASFFIAARPILFAVHQFIEGFCVVWAWTGFFRPAVTHDMGAAFMLYAQGLLPFLLPLSVLLFEA